MEVIRLKNHLLVVIVFKRDADIVLIGKELIVAGGELRSNDFIMANTEVSPPQFFRLVETRNYFVAKPL